MRAPSWWPKAGLWRHRDFLRLWAAQIVSAFGSRITRTALPVLAVLALAQDDDALGALAALQIGPMIAVALVAGGFVDRGSKRRILVLADLFRAVLVASLPLAAWLGHLTMWHVDLVAAGVGAATSLFRIADGALLPQLVGKEHLAEGNAKLEATEATAEVAGPAAAGILIAALGAPLAVLIDAATYLWSAAFLGGLRPRETPAPSHAKPNLRADLAVGLRAVFGDPILRRLVIAEMAMMATAGSFASLYALYCLRDLGLSTSTFGVMVSFGGVGALIGAFYARRAPRVLGLGRALIGSFSIAVAAAFLIPLAASFGAAGALALLAAHQLLGDGVFIVYTIHATTLRQTRVPHEQLGRANAAILACTMATLLASALAGGAIGQWLGTRTALLIGPMFGLVGPLALWPLRTLREIPAVAADP